MKLKDLDKQRRKNTQTERKQNEVDEQLLAFRTLYGNSFYEFVKDAAKVLEPNTDFHWNWHHNLLCTILQKEAFRIHEKKPKEHDYSIAISPRCGKSFIISVCLNAWTWACVNPYMSFLTISHTDNLAVELSFKTKQIIESEWYGTMFPHVEIRPDTIAKGYFMNTYGGKRNAFSLGAGVTGYGTDSFLICDDLHNVDDSEHDIAHAVKTYRETIYNRVNNRYAVRIVIGQRVSVNDILGHLKDNPTYRKICIPFELTDKLLPLSLAKHYKDGMFWNEMFPQESIQNIKLNVMERGYNFQYLLDPVDTANSLIKAEWFDYVDGLPYGITLDAFIDTAFSSKQTADATAILLCGVVDNIMYIKTVFTERLEFRQLITRIKEIATEHLNGNSRIYIEKTGSGDAVIKQLRHETMLSVIEIPQPVKDKYSRVNLITNKLQSKRVKLVRGVWNEPFITELVTFPNSKHDDRVDALQMAVNKLMNNGNTFRWYM